MRVMPEANERNKDHAVADAALESVAAEVQTKQSRGKSDSNGSAADQRIADLERQLREANEKALRANAELDNYRKRSQRELAEERRYAIVPLVRDLLPV